jgi:hypothetical protein
MFEIDHKVSKFLANENSWITKLNFSNSNWKLKLDFTTRKNMIDQFQSKEFIKNESMLTKKQSIGLEYNDFNENTLKKLNIELGLPLVGNKDCLPQFLKIDGLLAHN